MVCDEGKEERWVCDGGRKGGYVTMYTYNVVGEDISADNY